MDNTYKEGHKNYLFDETKATILYPQIHRIATQHQNEDLVYDFFDDRIDILASLMEFYSKYPELIPNNVTLRLNLYDGSSPLCVKEIKGTGFIDINYRQTVKDMAWQLVTPDRGWVLCAN